MTKRLIAKPTRLYRNGVPITEFAIRNMTYPAVTKSELNKLYSMNPQTRVLGQLLFTVCYYWCNELFDQNGKVTSWLRSSYTHKFGTAIDFVPDIRGDLNLTGLPQRNPEFYKDPVMLDYVRRFSNDPFIKRVFPPSSNFGMFILVEDDHLHIGIDQSSNVELVRKLETRWY